MFDNMSQNKRLLIAVVLAAIFFVVYDYFMPKHPANIVQTSAQNEQISSKTQHPKIASEINSANYEELAQITARDFAVKFNQQGEIYEFLLTSEHYAQEDGSATNLINKNGYLPLKISFYSESSRPNFAKLYDETHYKIAEQDGLKLVLEKEVEGVKITKKIEFSEDGFYSVSMDFSDLVPAYVITPGERPNVIADSYTVHGGMVYRADETKKDYEDKDLKPNEKQVEQNALIAAFSDRYYTSFMYDFAKPFSVVFSAAADGTTLGFINASSAQTFYGYIGPKEHSVLQNRDERLTNVVEYGWFTFIAKPMFSFLDFIHNHTANWGWAIVIMTIIIRVLLFPLTYKSMMSMQKLKVIAPKIKELQEKYKNDPAKLQTHMMELYKKSGANPLGGCLPILIQIPIFFAIYRVLLNAIELKAAPWALWINDLSLQDPYYVLPIYMGLTMFLQQHITPMNIQDPTQAKIMKFLPVVFVIFFITFPAGLTLYWCVNNTFSLIQQLVINKMFEKKQANDNHK